VQPTDHNTVAIGDRRLAIGDRQVQTPQPVAFLHNLALVMKRTAGIIDVSGNEVSVVVGYDAGLITPEQVKAKLAELGHPVKP